MKLLVLIIAFASTAQASVINLSNGESITLGQHTVTCGGAQTPSYWNCTMSAAGEFFIGSAETEASAKADVRKKCEAVLKYPLCTLAQGASISCQEDL